MNHDEPWWHEPDADGASGDAGESPASEPGTGPEEAARLFSAIRDRVLSDPATIRAGLQVMEVFSALRGSINNPAAPGDAPECAYCPVCQAISRAHNIGPESVESVAAAAIQFAESLRQAISDDHDHGRDESVRHVPLDDESEDEPD